MHPKILDPLDATPGDNATTILAVPIGGAGVFPLGIGKRFSEQFMGNKRANQVLSLTELLYAAACETRLKMYFCALPEWKLFSDNNYTLDTPETTLNFMLYYIMIIVFPTEDAEIVFKGVVSRLITDNNSMQEQKPAVTNEEDGESNDRSGIFSKAGFKKVLETPRVKIGKNGLPPDVATQLMFHTIHDLQQAVAATGAQHVEVAEDESMLPDQIWKMLVAHLTLSKVVQNLQKVNGFEYPPFTPGLKIDDGRDFRPPMDFVRYKLIYHLPITTGKDQLALFMLPGIINQTRVLEQDDFDVKMIGESHDSLYVASETRGFSFKDPSKLLSPLPAICSKLFRQMLSLATSLEDWEHIYRYCHKYMRMLFSNPFVPGFPSIYRDLFSEIDRLRAKKSSDKLMDGFYAGRQLVPGTGVIHHNVTQIIALLHSAGLRDNHVVVALAYLSASGSCRIFGGDSDITAFTGTAGKGKSNLLNMISALVNDVSQYSMDAASARAITMPLNPVVVAGRVIGEAPQNGRITFTDDGAGAFQPGKGSHADKDGDAMKLTQASRGCITYQVITPHEDERGNKINKVQTRVVACKSSRFMAMNGNSGSNAGASRMQCFYVKSSTVAPAHSASAVCPLDVNSVPDELESMYAANQLRNAEVSFYNALIAFGLANDASVSLWQVFIIRALESDLAQRDFPEELKILMSPRKVGAIVRNSLNLANNKLFHLLQTGNFEKTFIGKNTLKKYMFLQQANFVSTELIVLALSSAMPVCNGALDIQKKIMRLIKELVDFDVMAPFLPRSVRKGGKSYYVLRCANYTALQQNIRDHMPEYEPADVDTKLNDICKTSASRSGQHYLEKNGESLIFFAKPLDYVFSTNELDVLSIMNTQFEQFRTKYPDMHDCFPHDEDDEYLLIPSDQTYIFSRHANNEQINELGNEFEQGLSLLQYNKTCGQALAINTPVQNIHPRDITKPATLSHHFPGTPTMRGCTAVNLKTLGAIGGQAETGFLGYVPCFHSQKCMIATGKASNPDISETVDLKAMTESFVITNPHYCRAHNRCLPSLESSVAEKEFFGTECERIEIPTGYATELYMLYTRTFVLQRQTPLKISRPDFIDHFLKHGSCDNYKTYFPPKPTHALPQGTVSIYELFKNLAVKMKAANLDDEIIRYFVPPTTNKRALDTDDEED